MKTIIFMIQIVFYINATMNIMLTFQNINLMNMMGKNYFMRGNSWIDIIFLGVNVYMKVFSPEQQRTQDDFDKLNFEEATIRLRQLECVGEILIYIKLTYFLSLLDAFAPLIDTIVKILEDIIYFLFVLLLHAMVFGTCFYLIG